MKFFRSVEFIFYVRGNTKNACDRLFNQMKVRFHKEQVHSYRVALDVLDIQTNVTMIDATEEMFKDYGKMLDTFYCNFEPGTIRVNHIFKVDFMDSKMEMQCYKHDYYACLRKPMLKRGAKVGVERLLEMKNFSLETLKPPGLREIKQVELYKKWRQYVDPQYWDEMCPESSDAVIQHVKSDKVDRRKQTIERANSSKSEKLQEQARKNAEM
jgi:hypothetical protein